MQELQGLEGMVVRQQKEWGEIATGFETKNKYSVMDLNGREIYQAQEEGGSFLVRSFLKSMRPFEIYVRTKDGQQVLRIVRPFKFYFHEVSVYGAAGNLLGSIKKEFSLLRRIYAVKDATGNTLFQLFGPILHPWTFNIRDEFKEHGKITKKWSGLLKEGFTDADNFGVTFPSYWTVEQKSVLLGAVFLIDFVHFEDNGRRR